MLCSVWMPAVFVLAGLARLVCSAAVRREPDSPPVAFVDDCAVLAQWGTEDSNAAQAMGWQTAASPFWCCEPGAQGVECGENGQRVVSLELTGLGIEGALVA